jgi:C4-dicarboxylate-specific signal transduction histidine kinase
LNQHIEHLDRQRGMGQMAVTIAHELSQPLTVIQTNAQIATRRIKLNEQISADDITTDLNKIVSGVKHAGKIIARIRKFIKPSMALKEKVELNGLILESGELVSYTARDLKVKLVYKLSKQPLLLMADSLGLSQVLINLLRNAVEASSHFSQSKVVISSGIEGEYSLIRISDTGDGFSPEVLQKMGSAFFTTKDDGLGMGIVIAKSIINNHGGSLQFCNAKDGQRGGIVELRLPILSQESK